MSPLRVYRLEGGRLAILPDDKPVRFLDTNTGVGSIFPGQPIEETIRCLRDSADILEHMVKDAAKS